MFIRLAILIVIIGFLRGNLSALTIFSNSPLLMVCHFSNYLGILPVTGGGSAASSGLRIAFSAGLGYARRLSAATQPLTSSPGSWYALHTHLQVNPARFLDLFAKHTSNTRRVSNRFRNLQCKFGDPKIFYQKTGCVFFARSAGLLVGRSLLH